MLIHAQRLYQENWRLASLAWVLFALCKEWNTFWALLQVMERITNFFTSSTERLIEMILNICLNTHFWRWDDSTITFGHILERQVGIAYIMSTATLIEVLTEPCISA
jgi:hypothetical protein